MWPCSRVNFLVHLLVCCIVCNSAMRLETKSSMEYTSPDGGKKMFVERSAHSDLDSSATGFIYTSDGSEKPGEKVIEPLTASEAIADINQAYESLIHPTFIHNGGGSQGFQQHASAVGAKGDSGQSAFENFQNGLLKKFAANQDAGFYQNAAGHNQAFHDQGGFYGGFDQASAGEQGGKFAEEKSHKKGHKTTGYHKVYHKDEYKKEHSFYDEADSNGHFNKFDKGAKSFQNVGGGFKKGGHLDAAYQKGDYGKKGSYDKGQYEGEEAGYAKAQGGQSHFANEQDFANNGKIAAHTSNEEFDSDGY